MPSAITAIFGGDARPLNAEFAKAEAGAVGFANRSRAHGSGMNTVFRETLVILREMGRGNWSRVPGSLSIVVQALRNMRNELGVFGFLFTGFGAIIGTLVAGTLLWVMHLRKVITESQNVRDVFGGMKDSFKEAADQLERQHQAILKNMEAMSDFNSFLANLSNGEKDFASSVNETLDALNKKHEMQRKLAQAQGLSEPQLDQLNQQQLLEIIKTINAPGGLMAQAREQIKKSAGDAFDANSASEKNRKELENQELAKKSTDEMISSAQEAFNNLPSDVRSNIAAAKLMIKQREDAMRADGITPDQFAGIRQIAPNSDYSRAYATVYDSTQYSTDVKGKKLNLSPAEIQSIVDQQMSKQALADQRIETLTGRQKSLDDTKKSAEDQAKAGAEELRRLQKTMADAANTYNLHNIYDPLTEQANGDKRGGFSLNSRQRIGAYATTPPDWKKTMSDIADIRNNTSHLRPGGVPDGPRPAQFGRRN